MLEKIMDLQILLYSMAALGTLGAIGMLTTNLTYRRMLKSTGSKTTARKTPKEQAAAADQPEGKMAEALENTGQASSQNESAGVVSGTFVHCDSWLCHLFFQDVKDRRGTSSDLSVCGRHCTGGVIALTSGVGFFLQRRAGDGYVGRLCGADEKLDRRDSRREKSGPCFTGRNRG